jgi:hypothetical protein
MTEQWKETVEKAYRLFEKCKANCKKCNHDQHDHDEAFCTCVSTAMNDLCTSCPHDDHSYSATFLGRIMASLFYYPDNREPSLLHSGALYLMCLAASRECMKNIKTPDTLGYILILLLSNLKILYLLHKYYCYDASTSDPPASLTKIEHQSLDTSGIALVMLTEKCSCKQYSASDRTCMNPGDDNKAPSVIGIKFNNPEHGGIAGIYLCRETYEMFLSTYVFSCVRIAERVIKNCMEPFSSATAIPVTLKYKDSHVRIKLASVSLYRVYIYIL